MKDLRQTWEPMRLVQGGKRRRGAPRAAAASSLHAGGDPGEGRKQGPVRLSQPSRPSFDNSLTRFVVS